MTIKPPAPPYLGPAAHTSVGSNQPIRRIVIHCTVSPCVDGGARATAAYFREQKSGGSAHYVVDPGEAVQVVYDDTIAWHAPPNPNSLGVELCDPMVGPGGKELPAARWADADHTAMLNRAANLVAQLALAYKVPIVRLSSADLLAGKLGVCGHVDVSRAWHQSDHWDPGTGFPWRRFLRMVEAAAKTLQETTTPVHRAVTKRAPRRRFYHVAKGEPYHMENSERGIQAAVAGGYQWIDLDNQVTRDGVVVNTHWDEPMNRDGFFDPSGAITDRHTPIDKMAWADVERLRSTLGGYQIHHSVDNINYALAHGLSVEFEIKSPRITAAKLKALHAKITHPERVQVKVLATLGTPHPWELLKPAHDLGFVTILLGRRRPKEPLGQKVPKAAQEYITYHRGPIHWV